MPSSVKTVTAPWVYTYPGGGSSGVSVQKRDSRSRSETVTTAEHKLRKKRPHIWIPPTAFSAETHSERYGNHWYNDKWGGVETGVAINSFIALADYNPSMNFTDLNSRAITRALIKLKDQNVNYAQAFAERQQTARLVTDTALKFAKGVRELRKGNVRGFADALGFSTKTRFKGVHETWLETQYGWKPLLSDVYGAMEDLRKEDLDEPQRYRITVRSTVNDSYDNTFDHPSTYLSYSDGTLPGLEDSGFVTRYRVTYTRGSRIALTYKLDDGFLAQMASKGFSNPANLAWELVPFSFVADWFIPIGSYLQALDGALGYIFVGGHQTNRFKLNTETYSHKRGRLMYYNSGNSNWSLYRWESSGHSRERKKVVRTTFTSSPLPRFPGFKNPFSLTHVGNAIALLGGRVR